MAPTPLSSEFDRQVGDLAATLGDATRRGIYIMTREAAGPVTATQVAEAFDIHANVARHHLDRLVDDGYLGVSRSRRSGKSGPGAGRPAKLYEVTTKEVALQFPARRYDLLSELLVRVVQRLEPDDAGAVAEAVGREYGKQLAAEIGLPDEQGFETAVQAVARAMMGVGFDTAVDPDGGTLVTRFCPFGDTAANHPEVVCRIDQGIVRGLMEAAHQRSVAVVTPHATEDEDCITSV
jgi:predicted ArsR family transcriptional regulator